MKYDLEDLLKENYAQKEKLSKECFQSILDEMKKYQKPPKKLPIKKILAAACVALALIVVGVVRSYVAENDKIVITEVSPKPTSLKGLEDIDTDATEAPLLKSTESNDENKTDSIGTKLPNTKKKETSNTDSRQKNSQEKESTVKKEERDEKSTNNQKSQKKESNDNNKSDSTKQLDKNVSKPTQTNPPESDKNDTNNKNNSTITPSIKEPSDGYVTLCSLGETSFVQKETDQSEDQTVEVCNSIYEKILGNRVITSRQQLQELIDEVWKNILGVSDSGLQQITEQLEKYDSEYFKTNALFIGSIYEIYGYKFSLDSVKVEEGGSIKVIIKKTWSASTDCYAPDVMGYYSCFVQIPIELIQAYGDVICEVIG